MRCGREGDKLVLGGRGAEVKELQGRTLTALSERKKERHNYALGRELRNGAVHRKRNLLLLSAQLQGLLSARPEQRAVHMMS